MYTSTVCLHKPRQLAQQQDTHTPSSSCGPGWVSLCPRVSSPNTDVHVVWPPQAAGITITDKAWTVLAPSNKAFQDDDLFKKTGLTAAQLLLPANKAKLVQVGGWTTSQPVCALRGLPE